MVHTSYRDEFDAEDLEEFFENAPVPIQCLAPDGTVLQANRGLLDLLGYERGRYVGQPFVDFHADSAVVVNMHAALTNGEPVRNMPARLRCQDGSVREVLITSSAYWKEDQLVHTRWLIHDAGESKRYERVGTTAEEKFQQVFQASPDAMSIATLAEGRFVDVNASYLRQTGHRREEVIGKTTAELDRGPSPEARVKLLGQLQLALERDGHVHEGLVNVGDPPALPGRPSVFDVSGSNVRNSPREPLKHHAGESSMNNYRSLNHTKWECQSRRFHPEVSPQDPVWRLAALLGGCAAAFGRAAGESGGGRASVGGSRPHAGVDSAEILGCAGDRVYQGEECDPHRSGVCGPAPELRGQHFWARGYYVSTVGQDERVVREYVQQQEREDRRLEQLRLEE